jgi:L-amino acid N-acyltransferase YncA
MAADGPDIILRPAATPDLPAIAAIYNEGIAERRSTFETEARSPEQLVNWLDLAPTPLVAVDDRRGEVAGWCRVAPYSARPCYAGVGEASVYVAQLFRGRGVGMKLATALVDHADRAGFYKLVGKLFTDNDASRALVARCGFREVGLHMRHGRLDGRWRDVLLVELLLGEAAR